MRRFVELECFLYRFRTYFWLSFLLIVVLPHEVALSKFIDADGHLEITWSPPTYGDELDHYCWSYTIDGVIDSVQGESFAQSSADNSVVLTVPGSWAIFYICAVSVYGDTSQVVASDTVFYKTDTGVDDVDGDGLDLLPEDYAISVHPSPVRESSLMLSWQVPKRDHYSIGIYDILGRRITDVRRETMSAGEYAVKLYKTLPSGVYFAVISSADARRTVKFSVLR